MLRTHIEMSFLTFVIFFLLLGWNIRLLVENTKTGQKTAADFMGTVKYSKPHIDSVTVSAGPLSDGYHRLVITGRNFCDRTLSGNNCGVVYRCGGGDDSNYCSTHQEHSILETFVESWSDTEIRLKTNTSVGVVYVQTGLGGNAGFAPVDKDFRSAFRRFSTNSMKIISGDDFRYVGVDLTYATAVPTPGNIRLLINVQKLGGKDKVRVVVNSVKTAIIPTGDITEVSSGTWRISFLMPPGMGAKQSLYVTRDDAPTTNRAYVSYQEPLIQTIRLRNGAQESLDSKPGVISTTGDVIEIVGSNFGDPSTVAGGNFELRFYSNVMSIDHLLTSRTGSTLLNPQSCVHTHDNIQCTCCLCAAFLCFFLLLMFDNVCVSSPVFRQHTTWKWYRLCR